MSSILSQAWSWLNKTSPSVLDKLVNDNTQNKLSLGLATFAFKRYVVIIVVGLIVMSGYQPDWSNDVFKTLIEDTVEEVINE